MIQAFTEDGGFIRVDTVDNVITYESESSNMTIVMTEKEDEMSERDMSIKRSGASWQVLQELLKTLSEQLGANAHEVILLKARLTCKNCLESSYHSKTASTPEEWRCKHFGAIPATFKGSCEKWQDNVARR